MRIINRLLAQFPRGSIGHSVTALAGGTAVAQILSIIATPVITRLYSPAEIGTLAIFTAFSGFWATLLSWRYELALLNTKTDSESYVVFKICLYLVLVMSLLSVPVMYWLIITGTMGFGFLPYWAPLIGVPIFIGVGNFAVYRSWALRTGLVTKIGKATVVQSATNAIVQVVLGCLSGGVLSLFGARLLSAWAGMRSLRLIIRKQHTNNFGKLEWWQITEVAVRYAKFPKYEMPSTLLDQLAMIAPVPILAQLYGVKAAGLFGLARTLTAIPNTQIGRAVADVFHFKLSNSIRGGQIEGVKLLFYKLLGKLTLFGLLPLIGAVVFGPWLVPIIFGKPWSQMGVIIACIAPWLYAALVVSSLSRLLSVIERQEYKLVYDTYALVSMAIIYVAARHWALGLVSTVVLVSSANVIGYGVYLLLLIYVMKRYISK